MELPRLEVNVPPDRAKVIDRWRSIMADPRACQAARRAAHEALVALGVYEAPREREPGEEG